MKISAYLNEFATKIHLVELAQFLDVLGIKSIKDFQSRMKHSKRMYSIHTSYCIQISI